MRHIRFDDLFTLLCVTKPYSKEYVRLVLYDHRRYPWFRPDDSRGAGWFVYDPAAASTAQRAPEVAVQAAPGALRQGTRAGSKASAAGFFIFGESPPNRRRSVPRQYSWIAKRSPSVQEGSEFIHYSPQDRVFIGRGHVALVRRRVGADGRTRWNARVVRYEPWDPPVPFTGELATRPELAALAKATSVPSTPLRIRREDFEAICRTYELIRAADRTTRPAAVQPDTERPPTGTQMPSEDMPTMPLFTGQPDSQPGTHVQPPPVAHDRQSRPSSPCETTAERAPAVDETSVSPVDTVQRVGPEGHARGPGIPSETPLGHTGAQQAHANLEAAGLLAPPGEACGEAAGGIQSAQSSTATRTGPPPRPDAIRACAPLFPAHRLERCVKAPPEWAQDVSRPLAQLRALYEAKRHILPSLNQAQMNVEFIEPILDVLGFVCATDVSGDAVSLARPQYVLFGETSSRDEACRGRPNAGAFYSRALAIAHTLRWDHPLRGPAQEDAGGPSTNVDAGIQIVAELAATGVKWGILTNGRVWQLYHCQTAPTATAYHETDLVRQLESADPDGFRCFWLLFSREAFVRDAYGLCFLDRLREAISQSSSAARPRPREALFGRVVPLVTRWLRHMWRLLRTVSRR